MYVYFNVRRIVVKRGTANNMVRKRTPTKQISINEIEVYKNNE